jgi:hypothetical protein
MTKKSLIFAAVVIIFGALLLWSGKDFSNNSNSDVDESGRMEAAHDHASHLKLPTIEDAKVSVQNGNGDLVGTVDLDFNQVKDLTDTDFSLKVSEFYTHWNWDGHAINISYEETNPAVKIEVFEADTLVYATWAFKNIPFFRMGKHSETVPTRALVFSLDEYHGLKIPKN